MISVATIQSYIDLTRPYNTIAAWLSFAVGAVLSDSIAAIDIMCGLLILTLIHAVANIHNDLTDMDVDRANGRQSGLLSGTLSLQAARELMLWLGCTALIIALISGQRILHVVFLVLLGLLSWLYNSSRAQWSRRPVLSILVLGLCFSALPLMYGYMLGTAQLQPWTVATLTASWWLQRMSISVMKDYKDVIGDKKHGKYTFYIQYGRHATTTASIVLSILGYASLAIALFGNNYVMSPLWLAVLMLAIINLSYRFRQATVTSEKHLTVLFNKSFSSYSLVEGAVLLCLILQ